MRVYQRADIGTVFLCNPNDLLPFSGIPKQDMLIPGKACVGFEFNVLSSSSEISMSDVLREGAVLLLSSVFRSNHSIAGVYRFVSERIGQTAMKFVAKRQLFAKTAVFHAEIKVTFEPVTIFNRSLDLAMGEAQQWIDPPNVDISPVRRVAPISK
jgi:hypothetical protein